MRCEPLARLGELSFDRTESGRDRRSIGLSDKTQTREASKIKHPLCVHSTSRGRWGCWRLRYSPGLERWALGIPASGLFIHMTDTQEGAFLPGPSNELHTCWETCACKTTRHGEGRETGEAHRARQTAHVSLWRGAANGIGRIGSGGRDNGIDLGQGRQEFSRDHLP